MQFSDRQGLTRLLVTTLHLTLTIALGAAMARTWHERVPFPIEAAWRITTFPLGTLIEPAMRQLTNIRFAGLLAAILLLVMNSLLWASLLTAGIKKYRNNTG